jgi:hypothetical protein
MDDRFSSGKDFSVISYYQCVLFQVPMHPFDRENLCLVDVLLFVILHSSIHHHISIFSDMQLTGLQSNRMFT